MHQIHTIPMRSEDCSSVLVPEATLELEWHRDFVRAIGRAAQYCETGYTLTRQLYTRRRHNFLHQALGRSRQRRNRFIQARAICALATLRWRRRFSRESFVGSSGNGAPGIHLSCPLSLSAQAHGGSQTTEYLTTCGGYRQSSKCIVKYEPASESQGHAYDAASSDR